MSEFEPEHASLWIKEQVRQAGFDKVGIAPAGPIRHPQAMRDFLSTGSAGQMAWMHRYLNIRMDSSQLFEHAHSVICCAINYWHSEPPSQPPQSDPSAEQASTGPAPARGRIARYAWLRDYHDVLKRKLFAVCDAMHQRWPTCRTQVCVDSAPIHERDLAWRSGLGWIGKHTLLLNRDGGSWLLLAEIVTDLELAFDSPTTDHCGRCTACLEACPTEALSPDRPYKLDASQCISYATIELRSKKSPSNKPSQPYVASLPTIPESIATANKDWLFGCDICQEVCPFNRKPTEATDPDLATYISQTQPVLEEVLTWTEEDRVAHFGGSAVKRASLDQLKRNAHACLQAK